MEDLQTLAGGGDQSDQTLAARQVRVRQHSMAGEIQLGRSQARDPRGTHWGNLDLADFRDVAFIIQTIPQHVAKVPERPLDGVRHGLLLTLSKMRSISCTGLFCSSESTPYLMPDPSASCSPARHSQDLRDRCRHEA